MKNNHSKYWWWTKFLKLAKTDKRREFFDACQVPAFYYELGRRNFPLKQYPTFKQLLHDDHHIVYHTFGQKFAGWPKPVMVSHCGERMVMYDGYVAFPTLSWNLRASKNSLVKAFWEQIESERISHGISEPAINAGNAARKKGTETIWRRLELIDGSPALNSNERSHLSEARKDCQKIKDDFLLLWKDIEHERANFESYYRENPNKIRSDLRPVKWQFPH